MKWYYKVQGIHTRVRVFMNGGKCGDLCFRNEEFEEIKRKTGGPVGHHAIEFIDEQHPMQAPPRAALHNGSPLTPKEEGDVF